MGGCIIVVGDSLDVIDTTLRKTAMMLPASANSRKQIEIDFEDVAHRPTWAMNNRSSIGGGRAYGPPLGFLSAHTSAEPGCD
jgi:hypothetical protein